MKRATLKSIDRVAGPLALRLFRPLVPLATRPGSKTIAFVKLIGLGDTALMCPVLRLVRRTFPDHRLVGFVTPITKPLFEANLDVDELLVYDALGKDSFFAAARRLRAFRPSAFLDFEHHFRLTPVLGALSGARYRSGLIAPEHFRGGLFTERIPYPRDAHMTRIYYEMYARFAKTFDRVPVAYDGIFEYRLDLPDEARRRLKAWRAERRIAEPLIGLHAGGGPSGLYRRWPPENFRELVRRFPDARFALTGVADDGALIETIRTGFEDRVFNAAGMPFADFLALIESMTCLVSNDTGPVHIGSWLGTPTIGLYGPETPQRYGQIHAFSKSLYHPLPCSPCISIRTDYVPSDCTNPEYMKCLRLITVDEVEAAVRSALNPR
jgi:ADP-heptose:LPS heptosyltransferase